MRTTENQTRPCSEIRKELDILAWNHPQSNDLTCGLVQIIQELLDKIEILESNQ